MIENRNKMRYVNCPCCGRPLCRVSVLGDCNVEITCPRCRAEVVGIVDEIYMKTFEDRRGAKEIRGNSRHSTDMEAYKKHKVEMTCS